MALCLRTKHVKIKKRASNEKKKLPMFKALLTHAVTVRVEGPCSQRVTNFNALKTKIHLTVGLYTAFLWYTSSVVLNS